MAVLEYGNLNNKEKASSLFSGSQIVSLLEQLEGPFRIAIKNGNLITMIYNCQDPSEIQEYMISAIKKLRKNTELYAFCGVGSKYDSYKNVAQSFQEAISVLSLNKRKEGLLYYEEELVNIILKKVPDGFKNTFTAKLFKNCTPAQVLDFCSFINAYLLYDGSIKALSEHLFVHKNTVQYKIHKIKEKTGMDLRILNDLFSLTMAAKWQELAE